MADIINRCPKCDELPTIGTQALSGKPVVACMNICCSNMVSFEAETVGEAMAKWNMWAYEHEEVHT